MRNDKNPQMDWRNNWKYPVKSIQETNRTIPVVALAKMNFSVEQQQKYCSQTSGNEKLVVSSSAVVKMNITRSASTYTNNIHCSHLLCGWKEPIMNEQVGPICNESNFPSFFFGHQSYLTLVLASSKTPYTSTLSSFTQRPKFQWINHFSRLISFIMCVW